MEYKPFNPSSYVRSKVYFHNAAGEYKKVENFIEFIVDGYHGPKTSKRFVGVVDGKLYVWNSTGRWTEGAGSLVQEKEYAVRYLNVFYSRQNQKFTNDMFATKELAELQATRIVHLEKIVVAQELRCTI